MAISDANWVVSHLASLKDRDFRSLPAGPPATVGTGLVLDGNEYAVPGSHAALQVSRQQGLGGGLDDGCGEAGTVTVP